jgi:hypothetical protein
VLLILCREDALEAARAVNYDEEVILKGLVTEKENDRTIPEYTPWTVEKSEICACRGCPTCGVQPVLIFRFGALSKHGLFPGRRDFPRF